MGKSDKRPTENHAYTLVIESPGKEFWITTNDFRKVMRQANFCQRRHTERLSRNHPEYLRTHFSSIYYDSRRTKETAHAQVFAPHPDLKTQTVKEVLQEAHKRKLCMEINDKIFNPSGEPMCLCYAEENYDDPEFATKAIIKKVEQTLYRLDIPKHDPWDTRTIWPQAIFRKNRILANYDPTVENHPELYMAHHSRNYERKKFWKCLEEAGCTKKPHPAKIGEYLIIFPPTYDEDGDLYYSTCQWESWIADLLKDLPVEKSHSREVDAFYLYNSGYRNSMSVHTRPLLPNTPKETKKVRDDFHTATA